MKTQILKSILLGSSLSVLIMSCTQTSGSAEASTKDTMKLVKRDTPAPAPRTVRAERHDTVSVPRDTVHHTDTISRVR